MKIWLFLSAVLALGCGSDKSTSPGTSAADITYPAAFVVNGGSSSLSVIDLSTDKVMRTIELPGVSWPHHIYLSPARDKLALGIPGTDLSGGHTSMGHSAMQSGMIMVLDATTGMTLGSKEMPAMNHNSIFSPDGQELWTTQIEEEGKVLVYDARTLEMHATIAVGMNPSEVTFSADGTTAFVANTESGNVMAIDAATKAVKATIPVGKGPVGAWTGANGKMYVDNEENQTISVIDVAALSVEETVPLGFTPGIAAYNGPMNELWVSDSTNGKAVYFQREGNQWKKQGTITTGTECHAIAFTKDGKKAYVTNQGAGTVSVIDTAGKKKLKDLRVGDKPNGLALKE